MILGLLIGLLLQLQACSLYRDDESPAEYYEFREFDILELGKNITDMKFDPNQPYLYLADYGNNQILRIDVSGDMKVDRTLRVGSHPIALDITPNEQFLVVGLNGEAKLELIDLGTFTIAKRVPFTANEVSFVACGRNSEVYVSSLVDQYLTTVSTTEDREIRHNIRTGAVAVDHGEGSLFIASKNGLQKYDINGSVPVLKSSLINFRFFADIHHISLNKASGQVFVCLSDPADPGEVKDVYAYNTLDASLAGKFPVGSAGLGVAVSRNGQRVFVAPTDADKAGAFVVEFDGQTRLETNYYLAAGNLKERGLIIDKEEKYIYIIVFTPGDSGTFEPYNSNSYDLQRIRIK